MAMSALLALATITVALALLLNAPVSPFVAVPVAVSVMLVPEGVLPTTCSTRVKFAVALSARFPASLQVMVPVLPTAGTIGQVHPAGGVIDWNVVFGGVVCVKVAPLAADGPRFCTLWV